MRIAEAINTLTDWERCGRAAFTFSDTRMMFPDDSAKALSESLAGLAWVDLLERVGSARASTCIPCRAAATG